MCGIAGVFLFEPSLPVEQLSMLLDAIKHRGYSSQESDSGANWAIGANRLEIVDRPNGRQPFFSEDGTIAIVFNGEIYNYKTLRDQLVAEGCLFRTDTDTEIIAHGYHRWREGLFDRLDGMFAIIVHDSSDGSFCAARDPIGVKPLYFVKTADGVFLASEIKALLHLGSEIQEVPPGHFMRAPDSLTHYATWPEVDISGSLTVNATTLRNLFSAAIRKRVDTDLPVAVLLSAGIDSAAVIYEAARHHQNVVGFSIGKDDGTDVLAAKRLCSELDLNLRYIRVSEQELLAVIPEVIWTIESFEPNHIRGGCLSYVLSREVARAGYRIALCGEGADELFGGYREFGLALARGESPDAVSATMDRFVAELYKTQLKRVDRTGMRFTLEVREPFLDKEIISFAKQLPIDQKVTLLPDGHALDKCVLREAYRGILPDWVVDRPKTVLSLGAGFGSNGPEGMFYLNGQDMVSKMEYESLCANYPEFELRTREESYYFKIFLRMFGELGLAKQRPVVNSTSAEI